MDPNAPILIGLAGQAGSGKTVTADGLSPAAQVVNSVCNCGHEPIEHLDGGPGLDTPCALCDCRNLNYEGIIVWTHLFFALPLYRIVTARQKIKGESARDRILYEIHEAVVDLFGRSPLYSPIKNYDDLIALVRYVASIPCEPEGEKARTFMQEVGSLFREYNENVFVEWVKRKVMEEYREFTREYPVDSFPGLKCGVVVSDVRYPNEGSFIANHANGSLYKLTATPEVLRERLANRDGKTLTEEQANHASENSLDLIPASDFAEIIDTSSFSVAEQVEYVKGLVAQQYSLLV